MSRDKNGRFTDCGNPKGRPKLPKPEPPPIATHVERDDFFEIDNASILVTENGKQKYITIRKAIYQKLAYKAALGDTRAAIEWTKLRSRFVCQFIDEQTELMKSVYEAEKLVHRSPEDVTNKYLQTLQQMKAMLAPGFQI